MAQTLSMKIKTKRAKIAEQDRAQTMKKVIIAHIVKQMQKMLHAEFVKLCGVQTVAVNVWVAT